MISNESSTRGSEPELLHELPGWLHFIWLIYLGFLFTPLLAAGNDWRWLWPTLLSVPVFLFLYVRVIRAVRRCDPPGAAALPEVLVIAAMGYALALVNDSANTYVIYSVAVLPFTVPGFRRLAAAMALLLGLYALELWMLGFRPLLFGITAVVSIAASVSNYVMLRNRSHNIALQRASEEVHRMARVAERERISRDLHDLLGHTLSLIAIKSELAAKLLDRDSAAASREVVDVMNIAREALKQVRTAVVGIRAAALEGELASARALLETANVRLTYESDGAVLPADVESALAMIVREAVTNIQRHAGAREARIDIVLEEAAEGGAASGIRPRVAGGAASGIGGGVVGAAEGQVAGRAVGGIAGRAAGEMVDGAAGGAGRRSALLHVSDDGCGGITTQGNGLAGIRERVRSLGGTLELDSPRGKGTLLTVRIPLTAPVSVAALGALAPNERRGVTLGVAPSERQSETQGMALSARHGETRGVAAGGRPSATVRATLTSEATPLPTPSAVRT